jgi:stearoyl-CoA desaturase (delta-9 desaturase)
MSILPESLAQHRVSATDLNSVCEGDVVYAPVKSLWLVGMASAAIAGGTVFFSWAGLAVFFVTTGAVLLFGHSLGSHRKLIHDSFQCPKWLEYVLVYLGMQVGLAGPLGLMRAHELRDYAQRLPTCHDYLRHGRPFWTDGWWQLHCELRLTHPPKISIEPRIAEDRFYRFLEATWMWQQIPPALLLYALGGWGFVFFGTCARVTAGVVGHWLIGYFAHNDGGMHFSVDNAAVQGRNIRLTSILTMGECWHNNHHAFPGSARLGLFPGEWDPGWWMLLVLHRLGLVWNFRLPRQMPERRELRHIDGVAASATAAPRYDLRDASFPRLDLAGFWRLIMAARRNLSPLRVEYPAVILPAEALRRLLGRKVELDIDPALPLFVLHHGGRRYVGFPAVCIAIAQHGLIGWVAAAALLPLAYALESMRAVFALPPAGARHA